MSSSSPDLTVVVASNGAPGSVDRCRAALGPQLDGAELLVEEGEALVPELWARGIARARGERVALTISVMEPAPDWVATIRSSGDVVAGAIEPGPLRWVDWGEYLVRYSRDMLPFGRRETVEIPGDNCAYRRSLLEGTRELWKDGFWEPVVNRELARRGVALVHDPALVVRMGPSAGAGAFTRQRFVHGRVYGRQRGQRFGAARNVAGVLLAPAVTLVLTLRILGEMRRKGRLGRFLAALPLVLWFNAVWAFGEAVGQLEALRG